MAIDLTKLTKGMSEEEKKELEAAMGALDAQRKARAKEKERLSDPEYKAKQQARDLRKRLGDALIIKKAIQAGIKVTDEEIDAAIKAKQAGKR